MDVLERAREGEGSRLDFALDFVQTPGDGLGVGRLDDALPGEHGDVGEGAGDVLGGELPVEVDRGVDLLHDFGRAVGESAAPHRVAHQNGRPGWFENDDARISAAPRASSRRQPSARSWAVAALAVLYATLKPPDKLAGADSCPASRALAAKLAPLAEGDAASVVIASDPHKAMPLAFERADGSKTTLADFRGRAVLLNLWATWCVPCRTEMPSLDRLQATKGGADFEVVAVNVDTARLERRDAFLDGIGVKALTRYADPSGDAFETLRRDGKALGLPVSLLIDRDSCEVAAVSGALKWDLPGASAPDRRPERRVKVTPRRRRPSPNSAGYVRARYGRRTLCPRSFPELRHTLARKLIRSLVERIAGVAANPQPVDDVPRRGFVQAAPAGPRSSPASCPTFANRCASRLRPSR